jgi:hypothetical protein
VLLTIVFVAALAFTRVDDLCRDRWRRRRLCLVVTIRGAAVRAPASYPVVQRLDAPAVTAAVVLTSGVFMAGGTSGNISHVSNVAGASIKASRALAPSKAGSRAQNQQSRFGLGHRLRGFRVAGDQRSCRWRGHHLRERGGPVFVSPRAWALTTVPFDWYQPLYPAMWLWYGLIPVALFGLWRMRTAWTSSR